MYVGDSDSECEGDRHWDPASGPREVVGVYHDSCKIEAPRRCPRPEPHTTARLGRRATASAPSSPSGPDGPCASCWYGLKASRNTKSAAMRETRLSIPLSERPICAGACPPADWSAPTPSLGVVGPRDKDLQDMVTTQGLQLATEQYEHSNLGKWSANGFFARSADLWSHTHTDTDVYSDLKFNLLVRVEFFNKVFMVMAPPTICLFSSEHVWMHNNKANNEFFSLADWRRIFLFLKLSRRRAHLQQLSLHSKKGGRHAMTPGYLGQFKETHCDSRPHKVLQDFIPYQYWNMIFWHSSCMELSSTHLLFLHFWDFLECFWVFWDLLLFCLPFVPCFWGTWYPKIKKIFTKSRWTRSLIFRQNPWNEKKSYLSIIYKKNCRYRILVLSPTSEIRSSSPRPQTFRI